MKTFILVISLLVNIWFSTIIIKLERFHYSTQIGVCSDRVLVDGKKFIRTYDEVEMYECLSKSEPRTSDWWNLLYGLKIL
jgi:hypothetical protein